jgi:hypothetical protein
MESFAEGEDKTNNKMLTTEVTEVTARPVAATKVRVVWDSGKLLIQPNLYSSPGENPLRMRRFRTFAAQRMNI